MKDISEKARSLLIRLSRCDTMPVEQLCKTGADKELDALIEKGLVRYTADSNITNQAVCITDSGVAYLEYYKELKAEEAKNSRHYWFTTIISILALGLSGIALAAQLGLLVLTKS